MNMDAEQTLLEEYGLLREMIRADGPSARRMVSLAPLKEEIHSIWQALKDNAPPDFGSLYSEFLGEYERLKDFILYQELIGKTIVALGGGFSSGKSSFLNCLMSRFSGSDWPILPEDISPSTSVPTYLVHHEGEARLSGVNSFGLRFEIPPQAIRLISHGFGALEKGDDGVTLGHIVRNLFLSIAFQPYQHIAFLDTPGYSAPGDVNYSSKTDEQIARQQLNAANYILWFVQADAGTITEKDAMFLQSLRPDIPKLVILNKADKKPPEDIEAIRNQILTTLLIKNIPVEGVLTFSSQDPRRCQTEELDRWLNKINRPCMENQFAVNFKKLFQHVRIFYQQQQAEERRRLGTLNSALTLEQNADTARQLQDLVQEFTGSLKKWIEQEQKVQQLQASFFRELKTVGDMIRILMSEPNDVEMLGTQRKDLLGALEKCLKKKQLRSPSQLQRLLREKLAVNEVVLNRNMGGLQYQARLSQILSELAPIPKSELLIHGTAKGERN